MLILASANDKIRVSTGSAGSVFVHTSWMDNIAGAISPGRTNTPEITTGGAYTDVLLGSGTAGVIRAVKTLLIHNHGSSPNIITVAHTDGTTQVEIYRCTMQPKETIQYIDEVGFINPQTETMPTAGRLVCPASPGPTVRFEVYNGSKIKIDGGIFNIPAAGVLGPSTNTYVNGVAGQALLTATLYYVYVFNNAGTLTIDFSTTAWTLSATPGNVGTPIKIGDDSRTLVGLVYTTGSGANVFTTGVTSQLTRSFFNRGTLPLNVSGGPVTTGGSVWTPTGAAVPFVVFSNDTLDITDYTQGIIVDPTAGTMVSGVGIDSTTAPATAVTSAHVGPSLYMAQTTRYISTLAEGLHSANGLIFFNVTGQGNCVLAGAIHGP